MGNDLKMRPGKTWLRDSPSYGNGDTRRAVTPVEFNSHIPELLSMINAFKQLADEETFIGPHTGGDMSNMPSEAMRTTMNASVIMGNSALPFQEIVGNFDKFTVSVINALVDWNRVFNPDRVDAADIRPEARGATSLMSKEVLAYSLDNLSNTLTPEEVDYLDSQKLLKKRLSTRDLDFEDLLLSEEVAAQKREQRESRESDMHQRQLRMMDEQIKNLVADQMKSISQAQKNMDTAEANVLKTIADLLDKGADIEAIQRVVSGSREAQSGIRGTEEGAEQPTSADQGVADRVPGPGTTAAA
jgi:uncharacterized tellurite resistance protein B-like protein